MDNLIYYIRSYKKRHSLKILDSLQTTSMIYSRKMSVSRFGDGEMDMVLTYLGEKTVACGFQRYDKLLAKRLHDIIIAPELKNHMLCFPACFGSIGVIGMKWEPFRYWQYYIHEYLDIFLRIIPNRMLGDANFTRFYISYMDKKKSLQIFESIRNIWTDREVLIVEGEHTNCGIGNDIFSNAKSVSRVICPAKNAFSKYDEILETVDIIARNKNTPLILIALGPTATVLSYDLCKKGHQSIDIGHIDVEYEWMRMNAKNKVALANKYVNEVSNRLIGKQCDSDIKNKQIVAKVLN